MNEINDYAPALLKIKAAIKELEALLPAGKFEEAFDIANAISHHTARLQRTVMAAANRAQKAA